ncbi:MAG: succinyldiaminopimelate transaminase [Thiohalocapsa sp.]|jgi:N-succinyldiaminopimelate aminotransferase
MNPNLDLLQPYPFEKLASLKRGIEPPAEQHAIVLSIGEPTDSTPSLISEALIAQLQRLASYPTTRGMASLREQIAAWLTRRFALPATTLDPDRHILPVNGTREALFAFAQAVIDQSHRPLVLMPNPFYQIYEGAALLAGAEPYFLSCTPETGLIPDFSAVDTATWQRCQLLYLCSPGNPTGAVVDLATLRDLVGLAQEHDFVIASDECYSEIYPDETHPPPGLLQAAASQGLEGFRNCVVFHSLSKRSNAPGLRSGFVAGDARIIKRFFAYRTYHGCAMPWQNQYASLAAWGDEAHVIENRCRYRQRFDAVLKVLDPVLDVRRPDAGFYLWLRVPGDDTVFARELYAKANVTVLPGTYLSRSGADGRIPGQGFVRIALVQSLDECVEAAHRIGALVDEIQH